ncbi:hypothetical protein [Nonomuraea sp. NPDC050310]|uniref:hypothetical protein n=1 Tax=unclassified Nonomuraea TaxID=2593643 RepID=UPI0033EB0D39
MAAEALALHVSENGRRYDLCADVTDSGDLRVQVTGSDDAGLPIASLSGHVPVGELRVLSRLLGAAASAGGRPARHPNANQPWTEEDEQCLRELASAADASISGLMDAFGRSRWAIEARLARLGIGGELPYRR